MKKRLLFLWLTQLNGIGTITQRKLLSAFRTPGDIRTLKNRFYLPLREYRRSRSKRSLKIGAWKRQNASCRNVTGQALISLHSVIRNTRRNLTDIPDMPILFYCKGSIREMSGTAGIVGARRCLAEDKACTVETAEKLTAEGICIVSGMAKGIDSYAHTACIRKGGYTIAVLGNGLDICYPREHSLLMQRIAETGLLLSEYRPGTPPGGIPFSGKKQDYCSAFG
jgi:DNA processing protein